MKNNYYIKKEFIPNVIKLQQTKTYWTYEKYLNSSIYMEYDLYKFCKKLIKKLGLKSVLDIGCGNALKLIRIIYPECKEIYGVNIGLNSAFFRKTYGLDTFYDDDIESPQLVLDKKFDLIISADVIEHLENPDNLIKYIKKFSHKKTLIVISTPERDIVRGIKAVRTPNKSHIREWNFKEFERYLQSRNFKLLYHTLLSAYKIPFDLKSIKKIKSDLKPHLALIRRYHFKRFKHNQMILCQTSSSNEKNYKIKKFLSNYQSWSILKKYLSLFLIFIHIFFYIIIFKDFSYYYKILNKMKIQ